VSPSLSALLSISDAGLPMAPVDPSDPVGAAGDGLSIVDTPDLENIQLS
tara:strand:+ start:4469 stop:4615 length:147 start_codon:yes stop_codon:yes gene_type:complete